MVTPSNLALVTNSRGNLLYQHKKALTLLIKNIFSMVFILFVCIPVHPLANGRDISSYFCKFAPICKAPLYARMFSNLLYQHKKALTLLIKNIFSMVLYSLCVFQCIHFQTGRLFPSTSEHSPLHVRRPYMQVCLVTFCINTRRPLHY